MARGAPTKVGVVSDVYAKPGRGFFLLFALRFHASGYELLFTHANFSNVKDAAFNPLSVPDDVKGYDTPQSRNILQSNDMLQQNLYLVLIFIESCRFWCIKKQLFCPILPFLPGFYSRRGTLMVTENVPAGGMSTGIPTAFPPKWSSAKAK